MQYKNYIEAINNSFQDIIGNKADFGRIPVIFGNNFA